MNIKVIKFKNDLEQLKYERHLMAKKSRMKKLHKKLKRGFLFMKKKIK